MRTTKELLFIVLSNIEHFETGLCRLVNYLYLSNAINDAERKLLLSYIYNNRPLWYKIKSVFSNPDEFFWERGKSEPRIKWLKTHINKNK